MKGKVEVAKPAWQVRSFSGANQPVGWAGKHFLSKISIIQAER